MAGSTVHIAAALAFALALVVWCGTGPVGLLLPANVRLPRHVLVPVTGYAFSQVVFFHAYFLLGGAVQAVVLVLATATILNIALAIRARTTVATAVAAWRDHLVVGIVALVIVGFASWPYLRAGWGQYWHGGNPDAVDSLYGRDAYLKNLLGTSLLNSGVLLGDVHIPQFFADRPVDASYFRAAYAEDGDRQQFSSIAFWSVVLLAPVGLDAWLIQALLSLCLTVHGVYWLTRLQLRAPPAVAGLAALAAVGNNFYLTTFFNEHEGSLIYGSMAPVILLALLAWVGGMPGRKWLVLVGLWLYCVAFTYAVPLVFLLGTVALYALHVRWLSRRRVYSRAFHTASSWWSRASVGRRASLLAGVLCVVALGLAGALVGWRFLVEPLRERAETVYRSWGYVQSWVAPALFWGIWPSPGHTNALGQLTNDWRALILALVGASAVSLAALWAFVRGLRKYSHYWVLFLLSWAVGILAIKYVVADSYYLYKFLYTQQFVVIAGLVVVVAEWWRRSQRTILRIGLLVAGAWLAAVNIGSTVLLISDVRSRVYNRDVAAFESVLNVDPSILTHTFIDIAHRDSASIVRELIASREHPILDDPIKADYWLRMKDDPQAATDFEPLDPPVWSSSVFEIRPSPRRNLLRLYARLDEPEGGAGSNGFLWRGNYFQDPFLVTLDRVDGSARYLRLCAEPGPSIDGQPFVLRGYDADQHEFAQFPISGLSCYWQDMTAISGLRQPFTFKAGVLGHGLLPADDRVLNYRVSRVGLTSEPYDSVGLRALNGQAETIEPGATLFGNGWYGIEDAGQQTFRWGRDGAQLIVYRPLSSSPPVTVDIEPGPSVSQLPATLIIKDEDGQTVEQVELQGRRRVGLQLASSVGQSRVFSLHITGNGSQVVPGDSRTLDFRVYVPTPGGYDATALAATNGLPDVVPSGPVSDLKQHGTLSKDGLFVGTGWYPFESFDGQTFRWAANDADLVIAQPSASSGDLRIDVEPGPGLGGAPLSLQVKMLDSVIEERVLDGRQQIQVPLRFDSTARVQVVHLHVDGGGFLAPNDPRSLNFRVFSARWLPLDSEGSAAQ